MHIGCVFSRFRGSGHSLILLSLLHSVRKVSALVITLRELNWPMEDSGAFVIVLVRTRASWLRRGDPNIPGILHTVTRDATAYFSVIFSSHFLFVFILTFARVRIRDTFWIRLFSLHPLAVATTPTRCVSFVYMRSYAPLLTHCPCVDSSGNAV